MQIDDFLNYLRYERNRSPRTIKSYGDDLHGFEDFFQNLDSQLTWETVDSDVIRDWMASLMDSGHTASTVNRRLSALRSFYRYALAHGQVDHDPAYAVKGPKKQRPLPQFLKESEMDRLLDPKMWDDSYQSVLERTIIMMFYETGMRRSELVSLTLERVDFTHHEVKVHGKRDKERIIPFGEELEAQLSRYVAERDKLEEHSSDSFFLNQKGRPVTAGEVYVWVRRNLSKVCTLKKRSPHVLRHTFATAMLNHKADLESVKQLLGHASLSTTEIYTHTTFEQLKREYIEAHPRA
ncbi:MAG: tyrosine recombinase XerC [Prevotellaceae bacterium]|nr:tyrosine recombinase XerC [Prevotellaceae bacterium]